MKSRTRTCEVQQVGGERERKWWGCSSVTAALCSSSHCSQSATEFISQQPVHHQCFTNLRLMRTCQVRRQLSAHIIPPVISCEWSHQLVQLLYEFLEVRSSVRLLLLCFLKATIRVICHTARTPSGGRWANDGITRGNQLHFPSVAVRK